MAEVEVVAYGNANNTHDVLKRMSALFECVDKVKAIELELNAGNTNPNVREVLQRKDPRSAELGKEFISKAIESGLSFTLTSEDDKTGAGENYFYSELITGFQFLRCDTSGIRVVLMTQGLFHEAHERLLKSYLSHCGCDDVVTYSDCDEWESD